MACNSASSTTAATSSPSGYPSDSPSGYPSGSSSGYPSGSPSGYPSDSSSSYPSDSPSDSSAQKRTGTKSATDWKAANVFINRCQRLTGDS